MSVELNHIIVHARDNRESAEFLAHVLGLEVGTEWGPFVPVATGNGVTLDFAAIPAESIVMQHYAFLVSDDEFDAAFARIQQAGITYYADPHLKQPGEINHHHGGRGLYFLDPAGHGVEIIRRPMTATNRRPQPREAVVGRGVPRPTSTKAVGTRRSLIYPCVASRR